MRTRSTPLVPWALASALAGAVMIAGGCFSGDSAGAISEGDECVPYEDDCTAGAYCQYLDGRTQCLPEGVIARDEVCGTERCQRGSICMYGSDIYGNTCQQPCTVEASEGIVCDITRHTCFPAVDDLGRELSFGVCRYVQ